MIAMITAISGPGIRRLILRAATTITMTPAEMATSAGWMCGRARTVFSSRGRVVLPAAVILRGHHEVPGRTEDGEDRHREEHRVQAGDQRHPGDLGVAENLRDADGGQREAGQHVGGRPGSLDRQHALQDGQRPQPAKAAAPGSIRHRLTSARAGLVHHLAVGRPPRDRIQMVLWT
jgi:hypothetical protein